MRIAIHQVRRRWRQRRPDPLPHHLLEAHTGQSEPADDTAVTQAALAEETRVIVRALDWLDPHQRRTARLWLTEVAGLIDRDQLGEALGVSTGHAAVRVHRMRVQLDVARALVRALDGACEPGRRVLSGWNGTPDSVWRKRFARHAEGCAVCARDGRHVPAAERVARALVYAAPVPASVSPQILQALRSAADLAAGTAAATSAVPVAKAAWGVVAAKAAAAAVAAGAIVAGVVAIRPGTPAPAPRAAPPPASTAAAPSAPATTPGVSAPAPRATPAVLGARLTTAALPYPDTVAPDVRGFGARGDGRTDDTAAIRRALAAGREERGADERSTNELYHGRPKALYFPAGTYLVSGTLSWIGCCVTLQGQGSGVSVIRLADRAQGFADPAAPRPVLRSPATQTAYRHYLQDLTVDTGSGNPGAVGIDLVGNRTSAVRNVEIRSGDGQGVTGLSLDRAWAGPMIVSDVRVSGFDRGISARQAELGLVLEHLTLDGQRRAGIHTDRTITVRNLRSRNSVPAVTSVDDRDGNRRRGMIVLLDAELTGGAPRAAAVHSAAEVFLRDVRTTGYASVLRRGGRLHPATAVAELATSRQALFAGRSGSLRLPVRDTPVPPVAPPGARTVVQADRYGKNRALAQAMTAGKPTVYVPWGVYLQFHELEIRVPASVRHIRGFTSAVNVDERGRNGGGIRFVVEERGDAPLVIEGFAYGVKVDHRSSRPVALVSGRYTYTNRPGAGDLYLDDVLLRGQLHVRPGQRTWARQLYVEGRRDEPSVRNEGTLWALGVRGGSVGTVVDARPGSRTEILGAVLYPLDPARADDPPAFTVTDAAASLVVELLVFVPERRYRVLVRETRGQRVREVPGSRGRLPLFTAGP